MCIPLFSPPQISLYEQETTGKGMNPSLAVKQYSRSSADQEVPLPHELRPVHVLRMTMMYLMIKIMNLCDTIDVNFAEWYHFLWDRTRGIRKDITQQELCSVEAVELVEQCARFHIHCSARLVAEDPSVFDQKINTENLTKCLQTLKYMYHDLELKGVWCKNEAEFRAYIILLNLNDGNFMWEVQQLRQEVQKSEEVRFALQVYSALDKNNYVRFFKLVHSTTYLNACILLRYFVQVRLSALKTILKCFSPRQPHKSYPLDELTEILAFENVESTVDFLEYHGLMLTEDRTHVILDRRLFGMPEYPYAIDRAVRVIESKRTCSVGEIVSGGRLIADLYENHVPQNSFDAAGRLNITEIVTELNISVDDELVDEADAVKVENVERSKSPMFGKPVERSRSPFFGDNKATTAPSTAGIFGTAPSTTRSFPTASSTSGLFASTPSTTGMFAAPSTTGSFAATPSITSSFATAPSTTGSFTTAPSTTGIFAAALSTTPSTTGIFAATPSTIGMFAANSPAIPTAPSTTGMFAAASENIFGKEKSTTFESFKFVVPTEKPTKPTLQPQKTEVSTFTFTSKPPSQQKATPTLPTAVATPTPPPAVATPTPPPPKPKPDLTQLLQQKLEEERKAAAVELQKKLEAEKQRQLELEEKQRQQRAEQERRRRELLEKQRLAEIKTAVTETVNHLLDTVVEQVKNRKLQELAQKMNNRKAGRCLKIWRETVRKRQQKRKAVDYCFAWLMPRTAKEEAAELQTTSQSLVLSDMKRYKSGKPMEISIPPPPTVKKINLHEICYTPLLVAINKMAIAFPKELFFKVTVVLNNPQKHVEEILNGCFGWKNNTFVIQQNKTINHKITYCVEKRNTCKTDAHALIIIADNLSHDLRESLQQTTIPFVVLLQKQTDLLFEQQTCKILNGRFTTANLPKLIEEALKFLAQNIEKPPPIEVDTLTSFLTLHVAGDIWKRISGLAKWNSSYRECLKSPEIAIKIYNDNLDKLAEIIFDEQLKKLAEFPQIFSDSLLEQQPEYLPRDYRYFSKVCKSPMYERTLKTIFNTFYLSDYVNAWPPANQTTLEKDIFTYCQKNFKNPEKPFYKLMSVILQKIDPETNFDAINNFLWTDLMEIIALEKIAETQTENPFYIVYNGDVLKKLTLDNWFYVNYPPIRSRIKDFMVKNQAKVQTEREKKRKSPERFSLELDVDLDELLDKVTRKVVDDEEKNAKRRKEIEEIKSLVSDLKESMEIQKKINSTFQKFALENIE